MIKVSPVVLLLKLDGLLGEGPVQDGIPGELYPLPLQDPVDLSPHHDVVLSHQLVDHHRLPQGRVVDGLVEWEPFGVKCYETVAYRPVLDGLL